MKFRLLLTTCVGLMAAVSVFSQQVKTVTNADLEKYRNKRVQAERDYQENYARMGFPSPEELQKQIEKSRVEREALSARLTAERLQREQAEAERAAAIVQPSQSFYVVPTVRTGGYYFYDPYSYYWRRYRPVAPYGPIFTAGNGIPISNYNFFPPVQQPPINMRIR